MVNKAVDGKINLDLLKSLVSELEASIQSADALKPDPLKIDPQNVAPYIVEMSKAAGLSAGVMQEASMLILDIYALVGASQGGGAKTTATLDYMEKLLGPLKGGSGSSN